MNEHEMQNQALQILWKLIPDHIRVDIVDRKTGVIVRRPLVWCTPNGGYRTKKSAAKIKSEGSLSGVPDLTVFNPSKGFLWIEVKMPKGVISANQRTMLKALHVPPFSTTCVCRSAGAIVQEVLEFLDLSGSASENHL